MQRRDDEGKGASRRLRRAGTVPAIVYGGEAKPVSIELDHNDVWLASQNEWFHASILDLSLDGDVQKVLLRDMQRHPFKQQVLHLDFQRVNENEAIHIAVPLHFLNAEKSPAGKAAGRRGHPRNERSGNHLPAEGPAGVHRESTWPTWRSATSIHLSDLKLPKGVEIPELKLGKEHDVAVVDRQVRPRKKRKRSVPTPKPQ